MQLTVEQGGGPLPVCDANFFPVIGQDGKPQLLPDAINPLEARFEVSVRWVVGLCRAPSAAQVVSIKRSHLRNGEVVYADTPWPTIRSRDHGQIVDVVYGCRFVE